ncbi:MAG TPA: response regulator transcription factor, partial [Bacteroidetes bacterium]|nr:response regulator transcription factor [Bacteroidota bacterium]
DNAFLARAIQEKLSFFANIQFKFRSENGQALLAHLEKDAHVDVILMDIEMPEMNGIEATAQVKKQYPQIKVIMLTIFDDDENIFHSILAGADGYLLKDEPPQKLETGIHDIMEGGAPMSAPIAAKALKLLRSPLESGVQAGTREDFGLSKRELEILEQLCQGLNYQEIASNLFISPKTVRKHIENIYRKLRVHNKVDAVRLANKHRLI